MFRWGKSTKNPAPAAGEEVAVQKPRTPTADSSGAARKPDSPGDDINSRAGRFIEDTKKRWRLGVKSFGGR
uniref:Uncharacterized protein n=1 Tax=Aegilops tauschii TaxID=37682 RepID=M8BDJ2_AEGTA